MEKLNLHGVTLQGYAQGGWRTSIHVPEYGVIFDAGTTLPLTCGRYLITHGHPDHAGALPAIIARKSIQEGLPDPEKATQVYVPKAIQRPLEDALSSMGKVFGGRRPLNTRVHGLKVGDSVPIRKDVRIDVLRTYHGVPSVGYGVVTTTQKLKPEFHGTAGPDLGRLKKKGVEITDRHENVDLVVPGDTKIDFLQNCAQARKAKVLVHEVTVWDSRLSTREKTRRYGHTHVDDMIENCERFEGESLVLCHRSMKHTRREIEKILKQKFPTSMLDKIHIFDGGDRQRSSV